MKRAHVIKQGNGIVSLASRDLRERERERERDGGRYGVCDH